MPSLTLGVDHSGRPIVHLYVGVGLAKSESLRERGMPRPVARLLSALVDTGASRTVVEEEWLKGLGLSSLMEEDVYTASSGGVPDKRGVYAIELSLAEAMTGTLARDLLVVAASDLSGLGVQMLLGRDILSRLVLTYNGPGRDFSLEFAEATEYGATTLNN